jgi:hypothetical protein
MQFETVLSSRYRVSTLSKGGGKFRTIYIPDPDLKHKLRSFLPALQKIATDLDTHKVCHGFIKGRSCVTNAMQHIGYRYTVSLDIQGFFDSVGAVHIAGKVPDEILSYCLIKGAPRQGLPTSPLIANVALTDADNQIVDSMRFMKTSFSYTRYADDITISFDDKKAIPRVMFLVRSVLAQQGFTVNERKTRVQSATNGRRIVTGIGVDEHGLHATRKTRKNMRAALHQKKFRAARGLLEWALCKQPGQRKLKLPELYRLQVSRTQMECEHCRQEGLIWHSQNDERYILVHAQSGVPHVCSARPAPINRIDLDRALRELGFKSLALSSTTWTAGLSKATAGETLLILFRKHGIDVCLYNYAKQFLPGGASHSIGSDGVIYRLGYNPYEANAHDLLLSLAGQLCRGETIDRTPLENYG